LEDILFILRKSRRKKEDAGREKSICQVEETGSGAKEILCRGASKLSARALNFPGVR